MAEENKKKKTPSSVKNKVILNPNIDDSDDNTGTVEIPQSSQIKESKALTYQQRLKRSLVARRIQPRLKRGREIASHRIASDAKIQQRALRKAREIVRGRVSGQAGQDYEDMDYGMKMNIDKQLENKVGLIKRIARRLIPVLRRAERDRHSNFTHKDMTDHTIGKKKDVMMATEAYDKLDGADNLKQTTRYKQVIIVGKDGKRRVVTRAVKIKSLEEKVQAGLQRKSETSNIPFAALMEVFIRGVDTYDSEKYPHLTAEQYAFGRINKFITEKNSIDEDVKNKFKVKFKEKRGCNAKS